MMTEKNMCYVKNVVYQENQYDLIFEIYPTKKHAIYIHRIHSCSNLQTILGLTSLSHTIQCTCNIHI